jgi:uncharacterized protein with HEPN domain
MYADARRLVWDGYATVDDRLVWGVIENHASSLRDALDLLLQSSS